MIRTEKYYLRPSWYGTPEQRPRFGIIAGRKEPQCKVIRILGAGTRALIDREHDGMDH